MYYLVGVIAITCITVKRAVYHPRSQHIHIIKHQRHHKLRKRQSEFYNRKKTVKLIIKSKDELLERPLHINPRFTLYCS